MSDELSGYVDVWWQAVDDLATLLEKVPEERWSAPTDLPGWDVRAVAAHSAHLEALLGGAPHDEVEIGEPPHVRGMMGRFTEQGVVARRDRTPDEIINELRSSATSRHTALLSDPPTDPDAPAPGVFGAIGWSTRTLLRNRPLDLYLHEQDVRRAVGQPGNFDSPAAGHAADYLLESLGVVVGKRARAAAGESVVLEVEGHAPTVVRVDDSGRAQPVEAPATPTVRIRTDRESYLLLAGGRRRPDEGRVEVSGDADLAGRVLDAMGVTP
jgi:uncharacterized protein (TIGR03083 family)